MDSGSNKRKSEQTVGPEGDVENGESDHSQALVVKKQKTEGGELVSTTGKGSSKEVILGTPRTSNLLAPIMLLTGHQAEVYSVRFSPSGNHVASSSFDKSIFLWDTFGECQNYLVLKGHTNAVLEVTWSPDEHRILSCSADKTVALWDVPTGGRLRKFNEHRNFVNGICYGPAHTHLLLSGSDDQSIKLWDERVKGSIETFDASFPVMSVAFNKEGDQFFSAGIDNDITMWDRKKNRKVSKLEGHADSITGLKLSPDGSYLLSNSMDNTVRLWDIRPFAPGNRCMKLFSGIQHNFEKNMLRCGWSADGSKISAGSSDRFVYIWETASTRILYKLPGHRGSVNDVDFHPKEPIIASASSDQTVYLGEIKN